MPSRAYSIQWPSSVLKIKDEADKKKLIQDLDMLAVLAHEASTALDENRIRDAEQAFILMSALKIW